jgi:hypothetical protein
MAGVKGRSGTNKGKDKPWAEALRLVMFEDDRKALREIAIACRDAAKAGDMAAVREIGDRLDGKPVQESTVTVFREVVELTDEEIAARIAELRGAGASDGDGAPPVDPSQLN